tara:strand:+ start:6630 stop:6770 length:141 start_codon:yes stop_codon:yes gene_type:complete
MAVPMPDFSVYGIAEYMLFAVGLAAGFALFTEPMSKVESLIANLRN